MAIHVDGAGHRYIEFDMSDNEQIRATYIPHQDWAKAQRSGSRSGPTRVACRSSPPGSHLS